MRFFFIRLTLADWFYKMSVRIDPRRKGMPVR